MEHRLVNRKSTGTTFQGSSNSTTCETPAFRPMADRLGGSVPLYPSGRHHIGQIRTSHNQGCKYDPQAYEHPQIQCSKIESEVRCLSSTNAHLSKLVTPRNLTFAKIPPPGIGVHGDLDESDTEGGGQANSSSLAQNVEVLLASSSRKPRFKLSLGSKQLRSSKNTSNLPTKKPILTLNVGAKLRQAAGSSRPRLKTNLGHNGQISCKPTGDQEDVLDDCLDLPVSKGGRHNPLKARDESSSPESSSRQTAQILRLGSNNLAKAKRQAIEFEIRRASIRSGGFERTSLRLVPKHDQTEGLPSWAAQTLELSHSATPSKKRLSIRRGQSLSRKSVNSAMLQNDDVSIAESHKVAGLMPQLRSGLGVSEFGIKMLPSTMTMEFMMERVPSFHFGQSRIGSQAECYQQFQVGTGQVLAITDTLTALQEVRPQSPANRATLDTNLDLGALIAPFMSSVAVHPQKADKS